MPESVLCNLCEIDDATVVFAQGVAQLSQIVRCNRCGLMYASPRQKAPDHVQIATWNDPEWDAIGNNPRRFEKEQLQVRDYAKTRALLNRLYPNRGKLAEIGGGYGFLLAEFKKDGWDVLGVEPDAYGCRYAKEKHGIDVFNGILENAGISDESFDVVLLNHVIEHLDDPLGLLREINRVLKPNGHFVIETPRYDSLMFKLLGRRERSVNCDGHIYFFTTQTLKNLYEAAGFRQVDLSYVGRSLTVDRLLWNVGVISKSKSVQRGLDRLTRKLRLQEAHLYLNMRDIQRVCVQKVAVAPAVVRPGAAARRNCNLTTDALPGNASGRLSAVDHPGRAEPVDDHAEPHRPEGFLDRHLHKAVVCQCLENAIRFGRVAEIEQHGEALRFLIAIRWHITARQSVVAEVERGMDDLRAPLGRRLFGHGRIPVRHHHDDFATQALLIELEGRLALAVECQIGVQLHCVLLSIGYAHLPSVARICRIGFPFSSRSDRLEMPKPARVITLLHDVQVRLRIGISKNSS